MKPGSRPAPTPEILHAGLKDDLSVARPFPFETRLSLLDCSGISRRPFVRPLVPTRLHARANRESLHPPLAAPASSPTLAPFPRTLSKLRRRRLCNAQLPGRRPQDMCASALPLQARRTSDRAERKAAFARLPRAPY